MDDIKVFLESTATILDCDRTSLWKIANEKDGKAVLLPMHLMGVNPNEQRKIAIPLDKSATGLADTCAMFAEPFCVNKTAEEMKKHSHLEKQLDYFVQNSLVIPIIRDGNTCAVIQALNKSGGFCHTDYLILLTIAKELSFRDGCISGNMASNAIEKSTIIKTIQELSAAFTPILARNWNRLKTLCLIDSFAETTSDRGFFVAELFKPKLERIQEDLSVMGALVLNYRENSNEPFAPDLCHQIKGLLDPLSGIHTLAKVFEREVAESKIIRTNEALLQRFNSIIEQLSRLYRRLRFANVDKKSIPIGRFLEFIKYAYEDYLINFRRNEVEAKISLKINIDENLTEKSILTDPELLTEIIETLIINAAEEIALTKVDGIILVSAKVDKNGNLVLSVSDDGRGIPDEHINNIFTKTYTTKNFGNGLGLQQAIEIAEKLGGDIKVIQNSALGGAEFLILNLGETNA